MGRKKDNVGGLATLVIGGIVALIMSVPKEVWIAAGLVVGAILVFRFLAKQSRSKEQTSSRVEPQISVSFQVGSSERRPVKEQKLKGPRISPRWVQPHEMVELAGFTIPGGLFYFGSELRSPNGQIEPALIDPRYAIDRNAVDVSLGRMGYWPSYSEIGSDARRAYVQWLSTGRQEPTADVGYAFLFFYGLERRALVDAASDSSARLDLPAIEAEVRRLLQIYGSNRSFNRYASDFLDYLTVQQGKLELEESPESSPRSRDLPIKLRIRLAKMAVEGGQVPAPWALEWARSDPRIVFPKAAQRCSTEFAKLFRIAYAAQYGQGMKLPVNRTKLRIAYRPASGGFRGTEIALPLGDLPDITAVVAPAKKLESLVEECAAQLAPYSRYVAKSPENRSSLESILLLPRALWPDSAVSTMDALDRHVGDGLRVMTLEEVGSSLGAASSLTRERLRSLAHALEQTNIGMEPDILAGAKTPKGADRIVLFRTQAEDATTRKTGAYQAAVVTLDLACAVAAADGKIHPAELRLLMKHIDSWVQLSEPQRKRLRARMRLAIDRSPSLASLRSKLDLIPIEGRRAIGQLLTNMAQADGNIAPEEVRLLEKIYKALGIDLQVVYSDLHSTDSSSTSAPQPQDTASEKLVGGGLKLDMARIEALQRETEQVSALLSQVFMEESSESSDTSDEPDDTTEASASKLLGLDSEHTTFLRLLITRSSWSREELSDVAADMELMLDGALERINEAAFENFDEPLIEGEDPIDISRQLVEKLAA
jgi:uncharacterized tellurite resistance protein B-like protein